MVLAVPRSSLVTVAHSLSHWWLGQRLEGPCCWPAFVLLLCTRGRGASSASIFVVRGQGSLAPWLCLSKHHALCLLGPRDARALSTTMPCPPLAPSPATSPCSLWVQL
jgi:hypothetical protein